MMFRQHGFLVPVTSPLLHKIGYRLSNFEWLKCKETEMLGLLLHCTTDHSEHHVLCRSIIFNKPHK